MINTELYKNVEDEIRSVFALIDTEDGYYPLVNLPNEYPGYVVKRDNLIGVGIPISEEYKEFTYFFENISIVVSEKRKNNEKIFFLELLTSYSEYLDNFSLICTNFVIPGEDGNLRNKIIDNPQKWVDEWKKLLGNKLSNDNCAAKLGELIVLKKIYSNDHSAKMTDMGSHDIETLSCNYEVKTTTMRYGTQIEIHNRFQLSSLNGNPLYLYFVRLEDSISGVSINSILNDLSTMGYDISAIKKSISKMNSETKNKCYKVDEIREYYVNDDFPKITDNSFVNGSLPDHITAIKYTIDLEGLDYKQIEL